MDLPYFPDYKTPLFSHNLNYVAYTEVRLFFNFFFLQGALQHKVQKTGQLGT